MVLDGAGHRGGPGEALAARRFQEKILTQWTGGSSAAASLGRALPARIRHDKAGPFSQRFQPQTIISRRKTIPSTCPSKQNWQFSAIYLGHFGASFLHAAARPNIGRDFMRK